jgi:hypothetical protein
MCISVVTLTNREWSKSELLQRVRYIAQKVYIGLVEVVD